MFRKDRAKSCSIPSPNAPYSVDYDASDLDGKKMILVVTAYHDALLEFQEFQEKQNREI